MTKDLQDTNDAIHKAIPGYRCATSGRRVATSPRSLVDVAASLGMRSLSWAVDPRDWDFPTYGTGQSMVNHIMSVVQSQSRPGVVILSHDLSKPDTLSAYRLLIPWLKARYTLDPHAAVLAHRLQDPNYRAGLRRSSDPPGIWFGSRLGPHVCCSSLRPRPVGASCDQRRRAIVVR